MRDSWNEYFMKIAHMVATRATCDRAHVGAVIVKEKNIIATGYNGSMVGIEHCDNAGHQMRDGHCIRTVHAEVNAICQAAKHGHSIKNATLYVTHFPCWNCFKMVVNAGIRRIYYENAYRIDPAIKEMSVEREDGFEIYLAEEYRREAWKESGGMNGGLLPQDMFVKCFQLKVKEEDQTEAK